MFLSFFGLHNTLPITRRPIFSKTVKHVMHCNKLHTGLNEFTGIISAILQNVLFNRLQIIFARFKCALLICKSRPKLHRVGFI